MNICNANNPTELAATRAATDFIASLSLEQRAAWDALSAEERLVSKEYRTDTAQVQQHTVIQARIDQDTVLLTDEKVAPAQITRAGCRALAQKYDASLISVRDTTWTRSNHNHFGDLPEKCLLDRVYRYVAKTDSLEIFEHGKLIYINNSGFRLSGEELHRLAAECEFGA